MRVPAGLGACGLLVLACCLGVTARSLTPETATPRPPWTQQAALPAAGRRLLEASRCTPAASGSSCRLPQLLSCCTASKGTSCVLVDAPEAACTTGNPYRLCCDYPGANGDRWILQETARLLCSDGTANCTYIAGPPWGIKDKRAVRWTSNTDACTWDGVACEQGRVTQVVVYVVSPAQWDWSTVLTRFAALPNLTTLGLYSGGPDFKRPLPPTLEDPSAFSNLRNLSLDFLGISGTVPAWVGTLSQLTRLDLRLNHLQGQLPSVWGTTLRHLEYLDACCNQLSGTLPAQWRGLQNLTYMEVSRNRIGGTLPEAWGVDGSLPALTALHLSNNSNLTGQLPVAWGSNGGLVRLKRLGVASTALTGPVPSSYGRRNLSDPGPKLPSLQILGVSAGSGGLCGPVDASVPLFMLNQDGHFPGVLFNDNYYTIPATSSNLGWDTCTPDQLQRVNSELARLAAISPGPSPMAPLLLPLAPVLPPPPISPPPAMPPPPPPPPPPAIPIQAEGSTRVGPWPPPPPAPVGTFVGVGVAGAVVALLAVVLALCLGVACRRRHATRALRERTLPAPAAHPDPAPTKTGTPVQGTPAAKASESTIAMSPFTPASATKPASALPAAADRAVSKDGSPMAPTPWPATQDSAAPAKVYESPSAVLSALQAIALAEDKKAATELPAAPALTPPPYERNIDVGNGQSIRVNATPGGAVRAALVKQQLGSIGDQGGKLSRRTTASDYSARRSQPPTPGSSASSQEPPQAPATPMQLPELPYSDWELDPRELQTCTRPDGTPWKLGSGAFGTVFKALFGGIDEVAVKVFHAEADPQQQEAILKEVAILRSCKHDCIVPFLGACYEPGSQRFQLVTQFCAGGDLFSGIRALRTSSDNLSWYKRGRGIALDIARGLHYLHHHRRLLHADLKSSNVLLTSTGAARICDVGFADILDSTRVVRAAGFTFAWAAPELLEGRPCTTKADIYSFGVVLWELARGLPPRRGQLSPCRVPEECPAEVEDMIVACLALNPEERPSARELAEGLKEIQEQPAPPGAGYVEDSTLSP